MSDIASYLQGLSAEPKAAYALQPLKLPPNPNLASEFYERLVDWIATFDKALDDAHEVGVRLVTFGQSVTFHLQGMGYWNPSLMKFIGICDDGTPVELIQHVSQISILLMKMPRLDPSKPKLPIGFGHGGSESNDAP